jgi:glycosyltransferase involved in cell wall biosynthesis
MLTNTRKIVENFREGQAINLAGVLLQEQRVVKISVVIPTLNEAKNLVHVLPNIYQWVDEVILVDGHSSDGTVDVARELCPSIRVVMQDVRGKGAALRAGFAAATGDIIVMMDADGSTDPSEIPMFVGALLSGADFAKGSRFLQGGGTEDMPFYRKLGNWAFVWMVRMMFGGKYTDLCYGYNAFWKRVLPLLDLDCNGFEVETMMNVRALKAGLQIIEVPSFEFSRVHGNSNLKTIPDGWRVLKTIFREAAHRGEQMLRGQAATRVRGLTNRLPTVGSEINSPSDAASD